MRKRWALVLAIFLIAFSIIGNIMCYRYFQEETKLKYQWPTTQGAVLSYSELWSPDKDFYDNRTVYIEYTYELNGRKYSASQMWLYEKEVPKYLQGQKVTVYYDPLKPERSVIQPWALSTSMYTVRSWFFYGSFFAVIIGLVIIVSVISAKIKNARKTKISST
jgi:hypothetical protein